MTGVVIVDSVRTAVGKLGGTLINETADKLAATVLKDLFERSGITYEMIDEVILGQAKQTADLSNVARVASLLAEYPIEIPSYTVHRQCGSGLQTVNNAAQQIIAGLSDVIIAGGVESMSTAPFYVNNVRFGVGSGNVEMRDPNVASQPGSQPTSMYQIDTMGGTAETLAEKYQISREEQDEFAQLSQERAHHAIEKGYFNSQITPYIVKERKRTVVFAQDEHPRLTSLEKLSTLSPVFKKGGTVTAGNSSGRNDAAAALVVMGKEYAFNHGFKPKVEIISQAAVGCDPRTMGLGPVYATQKALKQANLNMNDIDVVELNEAFAAQSIACIRDLDIPLEKVNPNGGAIALGHPIGATGAILMTKLIHELERTGKKYGLVTLCIAGGLGISTIVENLNV
ncbi:thiolase family protein [Oceanobacillus damuensis]|uniref:thiolase family protein n=1 Tax=Oceanobacillus damuensis TaxID=937928 RepID=UPI0008320D2D|nr:thiolase family protein [Oceanobacillus damuensis]